MAIYTRRSAWNKGGTFANTDLYWYAKAVGAMQQLPLSNPFGWWFFAAIHGEYVLPGHNAGTNPDGSNVSPFVWGEIPPPPTIDVNDLPSNSVSSEFWDQCQHQSWYFAPWHRGYLLALESNLRSLIVSMGGPKDWALPYWDYFANNNIPPAFMQPTWNDGPNPLYIAARYGPTGNPNDGVYVPAVTPTNNSLPVNLQCFEDSEYTDGFGGPETSWWHGGGASGALEQNPHNLVHVFVGGFQSDNQFSNAQPTDPGEGLMSDPGYAGLDPIFFLHHANIDRLWAIWNQTYRYLNPSNSNWVNGPTPTFVMPFAGFPNNAWTYTPNDVTSLKTLSLQNDTYTYEDLNAPPAWTGAPPPTGVSPLAAAHAKRLTRLGKPAAAARVMKGTAVKPGKNTELIGASAKALPIKGTHSTTIVPLDPAGRSKISASLNRASDESVPDRVFISLENVHGTHGASVLTVYINLPEGANPADYPQLSAGSIGLFGIHQATNPVGKHGGGGLNFTLDITRIVDALHLSNALDSNSIRVTIVPHRPVPDNKEVTIGRISVFRRGQ